MDTIKVYDKSIHSNPDAAAWAKFYKKNFPDADEDLMRDWFANAMMAMHDHIYQTKNVTEKYTGGQKKSKDLQVTLEEVEEAIGKVEFSTVGVKTTLCVITMKNGFEVLASSSCVNPINYNQAIGEKYSLLIAKDQVWQLLGFLKQQKHYEEAPDIIVPAGILSEKDRKEWANNKL